MTTSTPNHNHAVYRPGVCIACSAEAPVLLIPGYGDLDLGLDGHRCCKRCNDELDALMREPDSYQPPMQYPYREW